VLDHVINGLNSRGGWNGKTIRVLIWPLDCILVLASAGFAGRSNDPANGESRRRPSKFAEHKSVRSIHRSDENRKTKFVVPSLLPAIACSMGIWAV
jgi:hypothetical protein